MQRNAAVQKSRGTTTTKTKQNVAIQWFRKNNNKTTKKKILSFISKYLAKSECVYFTSFTGLDVR